MNSMTLAKALSDRFYTCEDLLSFPFCTRIKHSSSTAYSSSLSYTRFTMFFTFIGNNIYITSSRSADTVSEPFFQRTRVFNWQSRSLLSRSHIKQKRTSNNTSVSVSVLSVNCWLRYFNYTWKATHAIVHGTSLIRVPKLLCLYIRRLISFFGHQKLQIPRSTCFRPCLRTSCQVINVILEFRLATFLFSNKSSIILPSHITQSGYLTMSQNNPHTELTDARNKRFISLWLI
jgi:hypothetical protein